MRFLIVTGPVRTGKTTNLGQWLGQYDKAGGFLTPDGADGLRLFFDVAEETYLPFEVGDEDNIPSGELVEVGRFRFWKNVFNHGNQLLKKASEADVDIIVLDEWGKLELRGKGFAEGAEVLIKKALAGKMTADVVVVVRDYLLEDFYTWCKSLIPKAEAVYWPSILDLPTE